MSKLKDLIALNILGWRSAKAPAHWACDSKGKDDAAWEKPNGELVCKRCQGIGMEPETDLNDALLCLERAAGDQQIMIDRHSPDTPDSWLVFIGGEGWQEKTLPLAMCCVALMVSGVPESLITQAMEK